ncbi:S66 peptidase family protein [Simiduia aestuariiviva]|uniref:Muramoyltetrapeptide carboxypeptidase n=1 Tax=Simiduia aestuariiviva TaxID=1510459 RepID=A0A839UKH6_9GAMM|nr:LD-carboxypeptidase [Simiduia aestuariiviva]MBB3167089.1 muramoyltetrapeptide carboxypeptidase [Simiduia aestuariiviva]
MTHCGLYGKRESGMNRRNLLKALALVPLASSGAMVAANPATSRETSRVTSSVKKPRYAKRLQPGMTVGLVAPAGNSPEDQHIDFGVDIIKSLGFEVKLGSHLYQRHQYLAGTDAQRAADINAMFKDPDVDAIICTRGGFGTPRLLPLLDYEAIARNPKILLGYSDITALLNAIHLRTGLITFHGPMAGQAYSDYTVAEFDRILMGAEVPTPLGAPPPFAQRRGSAERANRITRFVGGRARGPLVGGNLTLLCTLMGTPFMPEFRGKLLFLEDIGESPYRVDRMLTQLWLAGVFEQVVGVVFGKFTDVVIDGPSFSIEAVIRDRCATLTIPVVRGLMIGHVDDQSIIPVGGMAELDGDAGTLTLLEPVLRA